jgi:hypothetical protein
MAAEDPAAKPTKSAASICQVWVNVQLEMLCLSIFYCSTKKSPKLDYTLIIFVTLFSPPSKTYSHDTHITKRYFICRFQQQQPSSQICCPNFRGICHYQPTII